MTDSQTQSITDALRSDHAAIVEGLAAPATGPDAEKALADRADVVMDLVRHFVAEEQYLYPAVREHVTDGEASAGANFDADREIEKKLRQLEDGDLDDARVAAVWAEVSTAFTAHVQRQTGLFTALEAACPSDVLGELGDGVRGAEQLAPTRPRLFAPTSAPVNKVTSFLEGFIDRARDYYTHRGVE